MALLGNVAKAIEWATLGVGTLLEKLDGLGAAHDVHSPENSPHEWLADPLKKVGVQFR